MRGVGKSVNHVFLRENVHLAIVAAALKNRNQEKLQNQFSCRPQYQPRQAEPVSAPLLAFGALHGRHPTCGATPVWHGGPNVFHTAAFGLSIAKRREEYVVELGLGLSFPGQPLECGGLLNCPL